MIHYGITNIYAEWTKIRSGHKKLNKLVPTRQCACVDLLSKMGSRITQLALAGCSHMIHKDHTLGC